MRMALLAIFLFVLVAPAWAQGNDLPIAIPNAELAVIVGSIIVVVIGLGKKFAPKLVNDKTAPLINLAINGVGLFVFEAFYKGADLKTAAITAMNAVLSCFFGFKLIGQPVGKLVAKPDPE